MPELSRFFGIIIRMYHGDHNPPHFHAVYGDQIAVFDIDPLRLRRGELSARARRLVVEWAELHKAELLADWALMRAERELLPIAPLE